MGKLRQTWVAPWTVNHILRMQVSKKEQWNCYVVQGECLHQGVAHCDIYIWYIFYMLNFRNRDTRHVIICRSSFCDYASSAGSYCISGQKTRYSTTNALPKYWFCYCVTSKNNLITASVVCIIYDIEPVSIWGKMTILLKMIDCETPMRLASCNEEAFILALLLHFGSRRERERNCFIEQLFEKTR